jgi:hypothetical protein
MMANKNRYFGRMDDFMPVRRSLNDVLKSIKAPKEPRAVEVLKVFGNLQLIRYRLVSAALQEDLDAMGDTTQSPWNDKDYPNKVARFGVYDTELGVPLAVLTVFDEKGRGPELTFVTLSARNEVSGRALSPVFNELDLPPCNRMGTDQDMIQHLNLWYEDGEWSFRVPVYAVKVTFERTSFLTTPSMNETVDVLIPEIEGKPLHGNGDPSLASDNAYTHKMYASEELAKLGYGLRAGFSSWDAKSVEQVKILDPLLIEEVFGNPGADAAPAP